MTPLLLLMVLAGGCELLTWPLSLFQELLPIAIKYAPYALMFIEAPEVAPEVDVASAPRQQDVVVTVAATDPTTLQHLPTILQKELSRRQGRSCCVVAVAMQYEQDWQNLEKWLARESQLKIKCVMAYCDFSQPADYEQTQTLLAQYPRLAFYANGPLSSLSLIPTGLDTKTLAQADQLVKLTAQEYRP